MSSGQVLKLMKEKEIEYVDLRFTDPRGKLQHLTMDATIVDEKMLNDGVFFDGSSIAVESIVRCCNFPFGSVNLKSTYSISFSFNNFITSLELIFFFSKF